MRRTAVSTLTLIKRAMGVATAGALILSSIAPAASAPVVSAGAAALKSATGPQVTDVRWRGGWGGAVAAGIIGGLALGAIASAPYYSYGYAPYGYGYAPYGYAPTYYGYYGGPAYYGYGYGYGYGKQRPW
jgi:hypothetical protein